MSQSVHVVLAGFGISLEWNVDFLLSGCKSHVQFQLVVLKSSLCVCTGVGAGETLGARCGRVLQGAHRVVRTVPNLVANDSEERWPARVASCLGMTL
jgi:hypothetical protein